MVFKASLGILYQKTPNDWDLPGTIMVQCAYSDH